MQLRAGRSQGWRSSRKGRLLPSSGRVNLLTAGRNGCPFYPQAALRAQPYHHEGVSWVREAGDGRAYGVDGTAGDHQVACHRMAGGAGGGGVGLGLLLLRLGAAREVHARVHVERQVTEPFPKRIVALRVEVVLLCQVRLRCYRKQRRRPLLTHSGLRRAAQCWTCCETRKHGSVTDVNDIAQVQLVMPSTWPEPSAAHVHATTCCPSAPRCSCSPPVVEAVMVSRGKASGGGSPPARLMVSWAPEKRWMRPGGTRW